MLGIIAIIVLGLLATFIYILLLEAKRRWCSRSSRSSRSSHVVIEMADIATQASTAPLPLASTTSSACKTDNDAGTNVVRLYPTIELEDEISNDTTLKFTEPRRTQDFQTLRDYELKKKPLFEDPEIPATNSSGSVTAASSCTSTIPGYNTYNNHADIFKYATSKFARPWRSQHFASLRDNCLEKQSLFEDPEFPADDSSLQLSRMDRRIEWLRPHEIVDDPQFFVDGFSRFDVKQGELGDCWLLAATASLTQDSRLFCNVVPSDQSFGKKYAGIWHFKFWQYGKWVDVVIDDRLPTYRGKLLYMHSAERNEFWSSLLEKAYAKIHGSYEALKEGNAREAMQDFTGGVVETYDLKEAPWDLFDRLLKGYERHSLMACSITNDSNVFEARTSEGLIKGHAYTITKIDFITTPNKRRRIPMLRIRNPWGHSEWNGPWSDKSKEWRLIPDKEKERLGLTFEYDGEFWMRFQDWMKYFHEVEICNLCPTSPSEKQRTGHKKQWKVSRFNGEWVQRVSAGGCRNHLQTFWQNPQYIVTLEQSDEDDEHGLCTLLVALMQKNRRSRKNMGIDCLNIGFAIYRLIDRNMIHKPLQMDFFKKNQPVDRLPTFTNSREVSCRLKLPPGHYLIVPSTYEPNKNGKFLIRVFSEKNNTMKCVNSTKKKKNRYRQDSTSTILDDIIDC